MKEPRTKESKFQDAPSGIALIKRLKNGNLGIKFSEENKNEFAGTKYQVTDWPDHIKPKKISGRTWYVGLTNDSKGIWRITPQNGSFTGKVQAFASAEGEPPVHKEGKYKWEGKEKTYPYFTVLIEITDGDPACIGMVIPYRLRYHFTYEKDDPKKLVMFDKERSKYTPILKDFLRIVGTWRKGAEIKFTDNLLPKLQKRILKEGVEFQFILKDGWIDTVYEDFSASVEDDDDDPFWDEDENPKKKKKKVVEEDTPFDWDEDDE